MAVLAAGGLALQSGAVYAQQPETYRYAYGPHMDWTGGWYGMIFGPFFMILVLALIIGGTVLLVRWLGDNVQGSGSSSRTRSTDSALDVLKQRFARGEIDKSEYEERRTILSD